MTSYKEFQESDNIQSFSNGKKTSSHLSLKKSFNQKKNKRNEIRLNHLKEMLSQSKTGRQTLAFMEEMGTKVIFESMKNAYGYSDPERNVIALNPVSSDENLAVTFIHEMRHTWQDSQMDTTSEKLTPKALIAVGFATEADACATEVMFAHEMREKNPKIWAAHQSSEYAQMSSAFEQTLQKTGDVNKARADALETWYSLNIKRSYGKDYIDWVRQIVKNSLKQKSGESEVFTEDPNAQLITSTLFKDYDGKPFLTDPEVVQKKENLCIPETHAKKLTQVLEPYMTRNHCTPAQLGLDKLAVVCTDDSYSTCAEFIAKPNAVNANVIAAQKKRSR